ncbi:MAG TPA: CinA family nicotinamide mononucleotide deamidase-related protein [bacterium]|nr:CinA family nicotinamide mononucleotide deamidase-related protein [bacterium]
MRKKYRVEVICVGNELLYDRINTDINILSAILAKAGFTIKKCITVPDEEIELADAVSASLEKTDILIITGGLGPTSDDITRETVGKLLKRRLIFSEEIWNGIKERFSRRGLVPPEINKKQAYFLENSEIMKNLAGTAPGLIISEGKKKIVLLPGPPSELRPMAEYLASELQKTYSERPIAIYRYAVSGMSESAVEEKIQPLMKTLKTPYTILAHPQMIEILITSECLPDVFEKVNDFLQTSFGENYMGINPPSMPEILGNILKEKKLKISIAESCTGGLASKLITDIPGSSEYFQGAFIAYSNAVKKKVLKVPKTILKKYGAVSEETAAAMAKGAKKAGKSDVSISFTGIAGPSGATDKKPVGLVHIGLGLPDNKYETFRFIFTGNREKVREQAAYKGIGLMIKEMKGYNEKK